MQSEESPFVDAAAPHDREVLVSEGAWTRIAEARVVHPAGDRESGDDGDGEREPESGEPRLVEAVKAPDGSLKEGSGNRKPRTHADPVRLQREERRNEEHRRTR